MAPSLQAPLSRLEGIWPPPRPATNLEASNAKDNYSKQPLNRTISVIWPDHCLMQPLAPRRAWLSDRSSPSSLQGQQLNPISAPSAAPESDQISGCKLGRVLYPRDVRHCCGKVSNCACDLRRLSLYINDCFLFHFFETLFLGRWL